MTRHAGALLGMYLITATGLTGASRALEARLKTETGLVQSFHVGSLRDPRVAFRRITPDVDLAFLDADPRLPRRYFGVRWTGVWYLPAEQRVDLYVGGDDFVRLRIDEAIVLERSAAAGLRTASKRLLLGAGLHRVDIAYEQYGGGYHLNVQWAPAGGIPGPLDPESLFPRPPTSDQLATNRRLRALAHAAAAAWILPPLLVVLWIGAPPLVRIGRQAGRRWVCRSRTNWARALSGAPSAVRAVPRTRRVIGLLYLAIAAVFLLSIGRSYRADTGFSYLIDFGDQFQQRVLPAVRAVPHYVHERSAGYDGQFYAQLATEPLLSNRDLRVALDSAPYRARRILFSWTAFALGLGRPSWILQAYALQNVLCWLVLGWLLCRWLPPASVRNLLLWCGCLFSYGMIASVCHALVDGPSLLLVALGVAMVERARAWGAAGLLGLSALGRETNLLAGTMLFGSGLWARSRPRGRVVGGLLLVTPLLLWFAYIYTVYGPRVLDGGGNLTTPLVGYVGQWAATVREWRMTGWPSPARYSVLALLSLGAQVIVLAWRVSWHDPWWRVGIASSGLMALLGSNVWQGYPGSATRILLPMTFAFNVGLTRSRWFWSLLVLGNLTVMQGVAELYALAFSHAG